MKRFIRSMLLTVVALGITGSVAFAQTGSAGYYDFATMVRFQKDMRVVGNATILGDLTVREDVAAKRFRATRQTTATVTPNSTIPSNGTFQPLTAAAAVGTSSVTTGTIGDLLILYNTVTNTITLTDTGTLKLASNAALGQYDTLTLVSDGTNWLEIGRSNN
jgi:hypothetical protein